MRKSVFANLQIIIFLSVSSLYAQQLPKTLLWRISGNGLKSPSYLYGTMHLNDPKLFELGDSLLYAISSTDGFANELDLSQITPMITEMIQQQVTNDVYLKTVISKKTFDQYGPNLTKKFNKPAEEVTTMDIFREKNKWIDESYKGKKMETFLDAYLMGLAYRQGKWIGGIEDLSDQMGILNSMVDESDVKQLFMSEGPGTKEQLENMTSIYLRGDLEGLQDFMNGTDSVHKDLLLIRRNHKMAIRIDSLAHIRSAVFAIGALHLSGNEGLIHLLRARGFSVDPVFSTKKVKPVDYPVREIQRAWVEVNDSEGRYRAMMPGVPGKVKFYGIMSMEIYYNIFNGTIYMTSGFALPASEKGRDSTLRLMLDNMFGGTNYKVEKSLDINGISGKSYVQKRSDSYRQVYVLNNNSTVYIAVGFSTSGTESSLAAVKQFFDSYQPLKALRSQMSNSFAYTDSNRGYKITLPSKPNRMDVPSQDNINIELMLSSDPVSGAYYFCGSSDCKKEYVFQDDSTSMQSIHKNIMGKFTDLTLDTVYIENDNRILKMNGSMTNGAMRVKAVFTLRGNRYYTIMILYAPGKWTEEMDKTLASFQLLKYPSGHWSSQSPADSLFTAWAPDGIASVDEKAGDKEVKLPHYVCYDSTRVHNYIMRIDTLDNYFWVKNDSVLWTKQRNRFVESSDTVLSEKTFKKDGLYQYEFSSRARGGKNVMRMHIWLRGNKLYRMTTIQEPATIGEENVNRLFDQLHFNRAADETHIFDSKAALILKDLRSSDTLISRKANKALVDAPFEMTDIPLLQEAVLISYPEDEKVTSSTNGQIAEKLILLDYSSSVFFARSHYTGTTDPEVKNALLDIISAWHDASNYDSLGKLLVISHTKFELPAWVTNRWNDSLKVAAHLFPAVLALLDDSAMAPAVYELSENLLSDSLISVSIFRPRQKEILKYAGERFRKAKADTLDYTVADYYLFYILQRLKTDSCNAMLKKMLGVEGNLYHKQAIVLSLLKNSQTVSPAVISELAADDYTRMELFRNLKEYRHTDWFPKKYLTQAYFGTALAREAANGYSDQESDLAFIRMKEMKWNGKLKRFYFYDLFLKEDEEHWLVVAGPFNLNGTVLPIADAGSDVYSVEYYDAKKAEKQMEALVLKLGKK